MKVRYHLAGEVPGPRRDDAADQRLALAPSMAAYLPWLLVYPLRGACAWVIAVLTGVAAIILLPLKLVEAMGGQVLTSALALLPGAFLAITASAYALAVTEHTAQGHARPPRFPAEFAFLAEPRLWALLVFAALGAGCYFTLAAGGTTVPAAAFASLALAVFPAYVLSVAVEGRIGAGLNPLRWLAVVVALKGHYLVLYALLWGASAAVVVAAGRWPLPAVALGLYVLFLSCHVLGFAAYHRREALQLRSRVEPRTAADEREDEQQRRLIAVLAKIDEAVGRKDYGAAADALYGEPGGPADLRRFHEELFEQLRFRRDPAPIHAQGQRLITVLANEKRWARALDICEYCFEAHPDFEPETDLQLEALARTALATSRFGLFKRLVRDPERRYPGKPAAVTLAFLRAQYVAEHEKNEADARAILKPLLAQKDHPLSRQIRAYARALMLAP